MSLVHLAFFRWRSDLDPSQLDTLRHQFAALSDQIPEIRCFRWIYNNSEEGLDRGYKEGVLLVFDDPAARQRYLEHPAHIALAVKVIIPALENGLESVLVFDYQDGVSPLDPGILQ